MHAVEEIYVGQIGTPKFIIELAKIEEHQVHNRTKDDVARAQNDVHEDIANSEWTRVRHMQTKERGPCPSYKINQDLVSIADCKQQVGDG